MDSTFPKVQKPNPKKKHINKLQLYTEAAAKKETAEQLLKSPSTPAWDPNITQPKDTNVSEENINENLFQKASI